MVFEKIKSIFGFGEENNTRLAQKREEIKTFATANWERFEKKDAVSDLARKDIAARVDSLPKKQVLKLYSCLEQLRMSGISDDEKKRRTFLFYAAFLTTYSLNGWFRERIAFLHIT